MNLNKKAAPFEETAAFEVDRAMRVLADDSGEQEFQPSVPVKDIEPIIAQNTESAEKIKQISLLVKAAKDRAESDRQQYVLRKQIIEITRIRQAHEQQRSRSAGRRVTFGADPSGPYIANEDAGRSPMLRSSWNAKMLIVMFGGFLSIEPFFIALTNDVQTLSIVFFVVTIFFGSFTAYYFIDTREQELRMFLVTDDNAHLQESREVALSYSGAAFFGALFVQLVYALLSARAPVSTLVVTLIVLLSCACLFVAYGFMTRFERAYRLSD